MSALCLAVAIIAVALCGILAKGAIYGAIFWLGALSFGVAVAFLLLNLLPARHAAQPRNPK
jgi:hypothetical protein